MPKQYITPKEARERFGISKMTLYRWRKAGKITEYRLPTASNPAKRPCRYDPEEIERLLRSEKTEG